MFILKRQDVEISSVQHPTRGDQQIPILLYQGQSFRLINVFNASQEEEARSFWRDLTDNRGKACVLLEEPERYSVWGKVRLDQLGSEVQATPDSAPPGFTQAAILLLQAVYADVEDMLGAKQAGMFQKDIGELLKQWRFPQTDSPESVKGLLNVDPMTMIQVPPWQEHHINTLLQELHKLGKRYFGNANFTERVLDSLQDLPSGDRKQFMTWLKQSPNHKEWR